MAIDDGKPDASDRHVFKAATPRHVWQFLVQMDQWEAEGETVLVHCHAGISRISSFAIAWLMHKSGANRNSDLERMWDEAERRILKVRPIIMPHPTLKDVVLAYFAQVLPA